MKKTAASGMVPAPRNYPREIRRLLAADPNRIVIVDEAYVDFGGESCVSMLAEFDNLLVVQTMSKSRQLAGARVGFAMGSAELIADLNRVKYSFNPYNVNRLSLLAGAAAVEDEAYFQACCASICENRAWTVEKLEALGFTVLPSQANFLFAKSDRISGGDLYRKLKENGILVRWFDSDRIRDYVRITIGSAEQMAALVDKVAQLL
jgi:histidinol-phosphate aminotransferase